MTDAGTTDAEIEGMATDDMVTDAGMTAVEIEGMATDDETNAVGNEGGEKAVKGTQMEQTTGSVQSVTTEISHSEKTVIAAQSRDQKEAERAPEAVTRGSRAAMIVLVDTEAAREVSTRDRSKIAKGLVQDRGIDDEVAPISDRSVDHHESLALVAKDDSGASHQDTPTTGTRTTRSRND